MVIYFNLWPNPSFGKGLQGELVTRVKPDVRLDQTFKTIYCYGSMLTLIVCGARRVAAFKVLGFLPEHSVSVHK